MEQIEAEEIALEERQRAGVPHDEIWTSIRIMRALYGRNSVATIEGMRRPAALTWTLEGPQMVLDILAEDLNFHGAHECGHLFWRLRGLKGTRAQEERGASMIGAALIAPAHLVRRAYQIYGEDLAKIAATFSISRTSATLRLAEVLGDDRAVVTKNKNVLRRGFNGIDDRQILLWTLLPPRGIVKVRIDGAGFERGRVVLRAKHG